MFMKQMKFFLVALMAVVMGMSVTSCMNGDDNHNVTMTVPVKYNYGSFLMGDGTTKLVPTTELGLLDGTMFIISCQYDQSQVTANSTSIPVTLLSTPLCIDPKGNETLTQTKTEPTNPLYSLDKQQSSLVYYDKNTIVLTMPYWVKVTNSSVEDSEVKKHSFVLSYDPDIKATDTKLNYILVTLLMMQKVRLLLVLILRMLIELIQLGLLLKHLKQQQVVNCRNTWN